MVGTQSETQNIKCKIEHQQKGCHKGKIGNTQW